MPTRVRSHTKINLGLAIGPLRPDGFHQLTTVYQTLALHEWVTVEAHQAAASRITLSSSHPRVPTDAANTAWRMVERCLQTLHLNAEVHIAIDKQLPLQGGLAAGSANAVAVLMDVDDISARLGEITQPALIVHGEADRSIPLALGQLLRDRLPGASDLIEIPGAGHTPSLTHPDQVNAPLSAFLWRRA